MAIESLVIPVATGAIGVALGLGAALTLSHRKRGLPRAEAEKDPWERLRELTGERAEASAKKMALHRAYAAGSVTEQAFVSKDAHYTKMVETLDADIDAVVGRLSAEFLPGEAAKGGKRLRELSDLAVLSKELEALKRDKKALEEDGGRLYLQLADLEDDKMLHIAERNKLRMRYAEDNKQLESLQRDIAVVDGQRKEMERKAAGIGPRDRKIGALEKENRVLRDGLAGARKKLLTEGKEIGVLAAVIDRHAPAIDERKKGEELKALVQPGNHGIRELVRQYRTPKAAYEFVRDGITEVNPKVSVSYWLGVDDVLRLGAADPDDKAIVLCSMLRAMDENATVAMLEMRNGYRRAVVLWEQHVLDPCEARRFDDFTGLSREEALAKYRFDGFPAKRALYEFNDRLYKPQS